MTPPPLPNFSENSSVLGGGCFPKSLISPYPPRAKINSLLLKENTVDPKEEVQEFEEKGPLASWVPQFHLTTSSLLASEDCNSDPEALDFIKDTEAEGELSGLKEEDFYNGENFYCNCQYKINILEYSFRS